MIPGHVAVADIQGVDQPRQQLDAEADLALFRGGCVEGAGGVDTFDCATQRVGEVGQRTLAEALKQERVNRSAGLLARPSQSVAYDLGFFVGYHTHRSVDRTARQVSTALRAPRSRSAV